MREMLGAIGVGRYAKAIMAILGQALAYAQLYYGHNHYVAIATAAFAALGVYAVPNTPAPAPKAPARVVP